MEWSYSKEIKSFPAFNLHVSDSGSDYSIKKESKPFYFETKPVIKDYYEQPSSYSENIFSEAIQKITSRDMQAIRQSIIDANTQREELEWDRLKIKSSLRRSKVWLATSYVLLFGLVRKSVRERIEANIVAKKDAIRKVEEYIQESSVSINVDIHPIVQYNYDRLIKAFGLLCESRKIWDITSENFENNVASRAAYSTVVKKTEVRFEMASLYGIRSPVEALKLRNANGADIYIYPSFVVMYSSKNDFAIIGLHELKFYHSSVRFVENGSVPSDSKIIDRTWLKVNKNGTPDRRFTSNYQIPVLQYGEINLSTDSGVHEQYYFSNYEASEEFANAFRDYLHLVKP